MPRFVFAAATCLAIVAGCSATSSPPDAAESTREPVTRFCGAPYVYISNYTPACTTRPPPSRAFEPESPFERTLMLNQCSRPIQLGLVEDGTTVISPANAIDASLCPASCTIIQTVDVYSSVAPVDAREWVVPAGGLAADSCVQPAPPGYVWVLFDPRCPSACVI